MIVPSKISAILIPDLLLLLTMPFKLVTKVEASPKRVRCLFAGSFIVDTKQAKLVWEKPNYPIYFFLESDVPEKYLQRSDETQSKGVETFDLILPGSSTIVHRAVSKFHKAEFDPERVLNGLVKINFSACEWFEEEEQIFVHPKDPYKRVDVLQSSRHVRVEVNGVEVANTHKPRLLFETSLPVRTYIPKTDCRMDLLKASKQNLSTQCPYKGVASYYDIHLPSGEVLENLVWWYRTAQPECGTISGFVAFYDEFVDVWVDGEKRERPSSVGSK